MYDKWWLKSKMVIVNLLFLAIAILGLALGQVDLVSSEWVKYIVFVQSVLNLMLRFVTDEPITLFVPKQKRRW